MLDLANTNSDSPSLLKKRVWVYLQSPQAYEVAPCACGNSNTQWSEFEHHVWCDKCEIDFIPEHSGVFSGPILINTAQMMGLHFSRLILETNIVEVLDSDNLYTPCLNPQDVIASGLISVKLKIKNLNSFGNFNLIGEANINIQTFELDDVKVDTNDFTLAHIEIIFDYQERKTFKLIMQKMFSFSVPELQATPDLEALKAYILKHNLEASIAQENKGKTIKV